MKKNKKHQTKDTNITKECTVHIRECPKALKKISLKELKSHTLRKEASL